MILSKKEFNKRVNKAVNKERSRMWEDERRRNEMNNIWRSITDLSDRVRKLEHPEKDKK